MRAKNISIRGKILLFTVLFSSIFVPTNAYAVFHFWEINEIYSNSDGTFQFIELFTSFDGQQFVGGHDIDATSDGNTNTFTFGNNSQTPTSGHNLLLATSAIAATPGFPTPDYTIQSNFFEPTANSTTINFIGADSVTINGGIPIDGINSVDDSGTELTASPTNYDGATANPPFSPNPCSPPLSGNWVILSGCTMTSNGTITEGNLIVQNNSTLTIPANVTLGLNFTSNHILVQIGSGIFLNGTIN